MKVAEGTEETERDKQTDRKINGKMSFFAIFLHYLVAVVWVERIEKNGVRRRREEGG